MILNNLFLFFALLLSTTVYPMSGTLFSTDESSLLTIKCSHPLNSGRTCNINQLFFIKDKPEDAPTREELRMSNDIREAKNRSDIHKTMCAALKPNLAHILELSQSEKKSLKQLCLKNPDIENLIDIFLLTWPASERKKKQTCKIMHNEQAYIFINSGKDTWVAQTKDNCMSVTIVIKTHDDFVVTHYKQTKTKINFSPACKVSQEGSMEFSAFGIKKEYNCKYFE